MVIFNLTEAQLRARKSIKWTTYPQEVLPLWVAEMDSAIQPEVREVLTQALAASDTGYASGDSYQEAFAEMATNLWDWQIAPSQIRRAVDVMHNISAILKTVTNPGDKVLINTPAYPSFRIVISGLGREICASPMLNHRLDLADIERCMITEKPKAYLLCSPHNPNGTVHTESELTKILELCNKYQVQLIVDEIHAPIVASDTKFVPVLKLPQAKQVYVCTSAGKSWNLAAFKAGLIITSPEVSNIFCNLPPLTIGASGHWGVLAHSAALRYCQGWISELCEEIAMHKIFLQELLAEYLPLAKYQIMPGTYLAWVDLSAYQLSKIPISENTLSTQTYCNPGPIEPSAGAYLLDYAKVAFGKGEDYDPQAHDWIRVNLATHKDIIHEAIQRAGKAVARRQ